MNKKRGQSSKTALETLQNCVRFSHFGQYLRIVNIRWKLLVKSSTGATFSSKIITNAKPNDSIEINLKMLVEYKNMSERIYFNTYYEIFDENNNSLYISSINNNDYQCFSSKVSIKENIIIILQEILKI